MRCALCEEGGIGISIFGAENACCPNRHGPNARLTNGCIRTGASQTGMSRTGTSRTARPERRDPNGANPRRAWRRRARYARLFQASRAHRPRIRLACALRRPPPIPRRRRRACAARTRPHRHQGHRAVARTAKKICNGAFALSSQSMCRASMERSGEGFGERRNVNGRDDPLPEWSAPMQRWREAGEPF